MAKITDTRLKIILESIKWLLWFGMTFFLVYIHVYMKPVEWYLFGIGALIMWLDVDHLVKMAKWK